MKDRILIFTEVFSSTGMGHFARCTALYDSFVELGKTPLFLLNTDGSGSVFYAHYNIRHIDWINLEKLKDILNELSPDLSIVDSYLANESTYDLITAASKRTVCIDDNKRLRYPPSSIILNPGIIGNKLGYDREEYKVYAGAEFALLRKPFRINLQKKIIKKHIEKVLITTGGSDNKNITPSILRSVRKTLPDAKIFVVIGPSFLNLKEIEEISDANIELVSSPDANKMCAMMQEVDLGLTAGGQTMYEFAKCGLPIIVFQTIENQIGNIKGFADAGAALSIGKVEADDFNEKLIFSLQSLKESSVRRSFSYLGSHLVDGKGSDRTVALLVDYY